MEDDEIEFEEITIDGEYWFDETGSTMYADGDTGDMNHEAHVIQQCASTVGNYFNVDLGDGYIGLEHGSSMEDEILRDIIDDLDIEGDERDAKEEEIKNDPAQAIIDHLVHEHGMEETKASDLVLTAYGSISDAREYAIKNWNWARVHGNSIEVNKLNSETLKNIASGIWNALEEEGKMDWSDEQRFAAGQSEYNISTYTGKHYTIKLDDMEHPENIQGLEEVIVPPKTAATQQVRDMDVESMPDYYKQKGQDGLIGDSFSYKKFFKVFLEQSEQIDKKPDGECFSNARSWASANDTENTFIVHGKAKTKTGKVVHHAWVEQGDFVIDPTVGIKLPKKEYYARVSAQPEAKYTSSQANVNMIRIGNQGPWTAEEVGNRIKWSANRIYRK